MSVEGLTDQVIDESVHVADGDGEATVLEVVMRREYRRRDEAASTEADAGKRETAARVRELEARAAALDVQVRVAERTRQWLERWAAAVLKSECLRGKTLIKAGACVLSVLICAATVFIKQHSIVDVYAACALFVPIYFAVYFIWKTKEEAA